MLALAVLSASGTATWPTGRADCPCIDPWSRDLVLNSHAPPSGSDAECAIRRSADLVCYDSSYGSSSCAEHDATPTPECARLEGSDKPAWCSHLWCWVDSQHCLAPHTPSSAFFPNATISSTSSEGLPIRLPLAYSYETCGYLNKYVSAASQVDVIRQLATTRPSGKIRVSFPGDSASSYTVVGIRPYPDGAGSLAGQQKVPVGQGVGGSNRSGAVLVFMDEIFKEYNIPWEEVPVSARSKEFSPGSSYTACVHDVGIGNTDLCWGNFWPAATRSLMASFTGSVYEDEFVIIVRATSSSSSFARTMAKPFEPFDWSLWVLIIVIFGMVGITLEYESDETSRSTWDFCTRRAPLGMIKGWHGYTVGDISVEHQTSGSWLTAVGVGFSVLVLLTGYSAVVTTSLLTKSRVEIRTLEEGIAKGYNFCANADMRPALVAQNKRLGPLLVTASNMDILDKMDNGECDAAIAHRDFWYATRLFGNVDHCDKGGSPKVALPGVVTIVANSLPVRQDLLGPLSWMLQNKREAGFYEQFVDEAKYNYTSGLCPEPDLAGELESFGIYDLGAPLFLLAFVSMASLVILMVITRIGRHVQRKTEEMKKRIDVDGDGDVTLVEIMQAMATRPSLRRASKADVPVADPPESDDRADRL